MAVGRIVAVLAAAGAVAAVATDGVWAAADPAPRVVLRAQGQRVVATSGAGDLVTRLPGGGASVVHVDSPPGIPLKLKGQLRVRRGQRVVIDTKLAAVAIGGALRGPTGGRRSRTIVATQVDAAGHRWTFVVPNPTRRGVDRVDFEVIYHLDAAGQPDQLFAYEAGIRLLAG
jgi:hypothetical protein